jgi:hypothetical protein
LSGLSWTIHALPICCLTMTTIEIEN